MASDNLCFLDLVEVGRRIQARQLSSVEVTKAMFDRIARHDGSLKSYATLTPDLALAAQSRQVVNGVGQFERPLRVAAVQVAVLVSNAEDDRVSLFGNLATFRCFEIGRARKVCAGR